MVVSLETVIIKLNQLGFFAFLPFLLTSAVIYGLLKRSKIFGEPKENVAVNATVSIVAAFMVWAYPIIGGMSVEDYQKMFSEFFTRGGFAAIFFLLGVLIVSMFLPKSLGETLGELKNSKIFVGIILGVFIFLSILLSSILTTLFGFSEFNIDLELIYSLIFLIAFIIVIGMIVWLTSKS
ncbi:MAG: hypothetical protein QXD89_01140 [Candidatus Aenigmatarchaeota archaeon]